MALIICPECKKTVSDKAPACIHCGFPMPKTRSASEANAVCMIDNALLNFDDAMALFYGGQKKKAMTVITSKIQSLATTYDMQQIINLKIYITKYVDATGELPTSIVAKNIPNQRFEDLGPIIDRWYNDDQALTRGPLPTCPTCGSTAIAKLGVLDRAISFELVGFASNKIGKSFKCRNCGYTW